MSDDPPTADAPLVEREPRLSLIWIIPVVAAVIAAWLGWRTLSQEGPLITLSFTTADGIVAGQTRVKHKAVDLGTVRSIRLSEDMSHVNVEVRMRREAMPVLTDHARFWVVRPRLTPSSISGLETLVSGSYIEIDPGPPNGTEQRSFVGLEAPPAVRSGEPGHTYVLHTRRLGSLGIGSPVLFRDASVGEVLSYDVGAPGGEAVVRVFVRAPFDAYIREGSYFWNESGLSLNAGAAGLHLEVQSIQAVLAGAVAFDTPPEARSAPIAADGSDFTLYADRTAAAASRYTNSVAIVVHFHGSVRGLAAGAPVEIYGIQIGEVTDVKLHYDFATKTLDVPVRLTIQPDRISAPGAPPPTHERSLEALAALARNGLRAQLRTANYLTGQLYVAFDFFPDAKPAAIREEDGAIVVPSQPSDFETLARMVDVIGRKLEAMPIERMAGNLDASLASLNEIASGKELKTTLKSAAAAMASAETLFRQMNANAGPALVRLPQISADLEASLDRANHLMAALNANYGANSPLPRDLERLVGEMNDAARAIQSLADLLDQHPEALLRGRSGPVQER